MQGRGHLDGEGRAPGGVVYGVATEPWELDQIHRLNYRTFVEEIPQHRPDPAQVRIDPFHAENTYIVARSNGTVLGMLAIRGSRPFSLDHKLPHLDTYLPPGRHPCEVRLLAVVPGRRNGRIFSGLLAHAVSYCLGRGYDMALISGTLRQSKLYRHLGFTPFGPLVGTAEAPFQPMYLTFESFAARFPELATRPTSTPHAPVPVSFLPGPVAMADAVQAAFAAPPISHRSAAYAQCYAETAEMLCGLTAAEHVQLMTGTGTLANDAVAAQLSLEPGTGLVLSNGEFGERLEDHARRFRLAHRVLRTPWGKPLDYAAIKAAVAGAERPAWLWLVHCETSTGVLNDLPRVAALCAEQGIRLCVDCISSLGTVPVVLDTAAFATGVSGKGFAAYPGLCVVFHRDALAPQPDHLPRYLDLGYYAAHGGVPFTASSNLLAAFHTALRRLEPAVRYAHIAAESAALRDALAGRGIPVLAPPAHAAPAVLTLPLPKALNAQDVALRLEADGFAVSAHSAYLVARNWLQICLMGETGQPDRVGLLAALDRIIVPRL